MRRDRSHLIQCFAALLITFNRTQHAQAKINESDKKPQQCLPASLKVCALRLSSPRRHEDYENARLFFERFHFEMKYKMFDNGLAFSEPSAISMFMLSKKKKDDQTTSRSHRFFIYDFFLFMRTTIGRSFSSFFDENARPPYM